MKGKSFVLGLLTLVVAGGTCFGQTADKFYRLDFVVKELEAGRVVNARSYLTTVSTDKQSRSEIRAESKVPYTGPSGGFQQVDVSVNIDCSSVKEVEDQLSLQVNAVVNSVLQDSAVPGSPIVRQNRWLGTLLIPLRKATVLFSSDDVASKRQMQLELTATPLK